MGKSFKVAGWKRFFSAESETVIITSAKEVMFSSLFVCLFVCLFVSNFAKKTSQRICMKFSGKVFLISK